MASYADDIRRIAKQKGLKGGIGNLQPRDPIPGTVTPFDASLFAQANDSINPSNKTPEATDGDNPNTFNKGDGSGGDGTSGGSRDTNGPQDIEDILDDKAGPTLPDSNISDIFSGGMLNKITGLVDCDDGKCVTFNLDGEYIPPNGWYSPDFYKDPSDPYYPEYVYRTRLWNSPPGDACLNYSDQCFMQEAINECLIRCSYAYATQCLFDHVDIVYEDQSIIKYEVYVNRDGLITDYGLIEGTSGRTDGRTAQNWPSDGCYQLAFQDGKIVSHPNDPNAPDWAQNGSKSAATLCTQSGRKVKIGPASAGGTIVREVNNLGAAIGIVRVYNSDGTLRGAGDAAWIDSQKPR